MATVTLKGNPVDVAGTLPAVGTAAPAFTLTAGDLSDVGLAAFAGKKKILNIFLESYQCLIPIKILTVLEYEG